MANREKGEVSFEVDGTSYTLSIDLNAMVALEEYFSTPDKDVTFQDVVQQMNRGRMKYLRAFLWQALRKHHPDMTLEQAGALVNAADSSMLKSLGDSTIPDPQYVSALGLDHKDAGTRPQRKARADGAVDGIGTVSIAKRAASG